MNWPVIWLKTVHEEIEASLYYVLHCMETHTHACSRARAQFPMVVAMQFILQLLH